MTKKLENVELQQWLNGDKTNNEIFKLLKLDKKDDSIFMGQMRSTWDWLNKENLEGPMYLVLQRKFGEEKLKTLIDEAKEVKSTRNFAVNLQEGNWLSEGKIVYDIFKLLKLDEKGNRLFESPMLGTWTSYVTKVEKFKEKPNEFSVISYLEKKFGDVGLARILGTEKQKDNETTVQAVKELQQLQFKQWRDKGVTSKILDKLMLDMADMAANVRVTVDNIDFSKANPSAFDKYILFKSKNQV
ncbi:hypothetical protein PHMEG_00030788 [Phytophthora megakarya]|uniref:RxLR effector protein n=1 Tax=Phytophthora megakarya TaxID=4795 RepID=A0A225UZQ7_9STRA|nr:hypothetical protein PHMEG_00030788 [Phytophthora megakarya]